MFFFVDRGSRGSRASLFDEKGVDDALSTPLCPKTSISDTSDSSGAHFGRRNVKNGHKVEHNNEGFPADARKITCTVEAIQPQTDTILLS